MSPVRPRTVVSDSEDDLPTNSITHSPNVKERKRVQSRLAQQNYRRRIKARLDELEVRLKVSEQQTTELTTALPYDSTLATTSACTREDLMGPAPTMQQDTEMNLDFFVSRFTVAPMIHPGEMRPSMLNSPVPALEVDGGRPPHGMNVTDQPNFPDSNGLALTDVFQHSTDSQDACTPSQGSQGPHTLQQHLAVSAQVTYEVGTQSRSPEDHHDTNPNKGLQQRLIPHSAHESRQNNTLNLNATAPIQDCIRYITNKAAVVGFDNLDHTVVAYYTEIFNDTSLLHQNQRLSRNWCLPLLLSTLNTAVKNWSEWERRGFQEQITQGAEEIFIREMILFVASRPIDIDSRNAANNSLAGERVGSRRDPETRPRIQDHLPNLWALVTALLAKSNTLKPEARPDAALAVVETLLGTSPQK